MTIDGTPLSVSAAKRIAVGEPRAAVFGRIDAGGHADRDGEDRAEPGDDQRSDDPVGHAAAGLARRAPACA